MMQDSSRYQSIVLLAATLMFISGCDVGTVTPSDPGTAIDLSASPGTITNGVLVAAPGTTASITASLGTGSTETITVNTSNLSVAEVPSQNTITSGGSIAITVNERATLGDEATITFTSGRLSETVLIQVGYTTAVDAILATPQLSTLASAVQKAGLVSTLSDETQSYTVFAPSDDAFAELAAQLGLNSADDLLNRDDLGDILTYHVVGVEAIPADNFMDGERLVTAHPDKLTVVIAVASGGGIRVNNASVITPNLVTGNGVVHIIDRVLLPQRVAIYNPVLLVAPLKDPDNVVGSRTSKTFFNADDGETYSVEDVQAGTNVSSADIDFGYYYGASNRASLASPAQYPTAIYNLTSSGANWNDLNATSFRLTNNLLPSGFDAIGEADAARLVQEYEIASNDEGEITNLTAGDFFAFKTVDERYGLIRVLSITGTDGSDGRIELEVKVTADQ